MEKLMENIRVQEIAQIDQRTLGITWTDGRKSSLDVVMLRRKCPCAACIDEWSHEPRIKPEDIKDSVRPVKVESVGLYALAIHFNDGHRTGIYTFKYLRDLAPLA